MKKIIITLLTAVLSVGCLDVNAQEETSTPATPKWVSERGYWVIESNKNTPKDATVYFYNNNHLLVYKEEIKGKKLKLNRKKTLHHLKAVLEEAIIHNEKGTWAHQKNRVVQLLED